MQKVTKVNFSYSPIQTPYSVGDLILGASYRIVDISNGEILAVNDKGAAIIYSSETGECLSHPKRSLPCLSKYPRNLFMEFKGSGYGSEGFDPKKDEFKLVRGILKETSRTYPHGLVKILITTKYEDGKLLNRVFIGRKPYLRTPGGCIDLCLHNEGHYSYEYWCSGVKSNSTKVREHYCNTSLTASVSKHKVCYIGYCSSGFEYSFSIEQPTVEEIIDFLDNEWKN